MALRNAGGGIVLMCAAAGGEKGVTLWNPGGCGGDLLGGKTSKALLSVI
jgi:hypothetical protein